MVAVTKNIKKSALQNRVLFGVRSAVIVSGLPGIKKRLRGVMPYVLGVLPLMAVKTPCG